MKNCLQCKTQFTIYPEDKEFYQRIGVPEPTLCPDCRMQRRLIFRNERTFYVRKCDLCKKDFVSIYSSDKKFTVYCHDCWWSEKWNPIDYGRDFDFNKPFFPQFKELMQKVPREGIAIFESENCDYCNMIRNCRNCYMCSLVADKCEYCYYCYWIVNIQDCIDCNYTYDSRLCYETLHCHNCFSCKYLFDCRDCNNCSFSYDLRGCTDCFLCSNLRHQSYFFKNKPYSKEEYHELINDYYQSDKLEQEYLQLIKDAIHRVNINYDCEGCRGDNIDHGKNSIDCYDAFNIENLKYAISILNCKDCLDMYSAGTQNIELCYETCVTRGAFQVNFSTNIFLSQFLNYCDLCNSSKNLFGCIGLNKKEFCIFNKQYSENDYYKLRSKIIEHMRKSGEYGEFFPITYSPYAYNEAVVQEYYPLSEKEALNRDWAWHREENKKIDSKLPICKRCRKNFKLIPQELEFYKKINLPQPQKCYNCRYQERMSLRNPRKLWPRKCYKCHKDMQTSYSPDRTEKVYCEDCYNKEIY